VPGEPDNSKLTVYYDGRCPMCSAIMDSVRNSAKTDDFDLRDMHRERSLPFGREAIEREIHVTDRDGRVHRGAAAIFRIADQYPGLRMAARFARLPLVRALAPPVYGVVAANRRFIVGAASRIFWLKIATIGFFCIGLFMSARAWIGPRSYPEAPVFSALPAVDGSLAVGLFATLFGLAAASVISPKPQKWIAAFLAIVAFFCVVDQTRWQPWVFQYAFMLTTLALFSWDRDDADGRQRALNILRLVMAGTYVFSGLQKLNWNFVTYEFPWIVQPIIEVIPRAAGLLHDFGMCVPFIQVAFGLGLLTRRFRRVSLILAVSMHIFILAMLGPAGYDWNDIVWPWTAAMAVFDLLLFSSKADFSLRDVLRTKGHLHHAIALALFALLPFLSFFNLWDSYLSSALYSGNLTEAQIYASDAGRNALPETIRRYLVHTSADTNVLNLQRWAIEDMNISPYPETRVFKQIAKRVCDLLTDRSQLVLNVREQRMFFSRPETAYRCRDL
jgi:predicted DCC family thiol-disulfide oxidoreductase YuxK